MSTNLAKLALCAAAAITLAACGSTSSSSTTSTTSAAPAAATTATSRYADPAAMQARLDTAGMHPTCQAPRFQPGYSWVTCTLPSGEAIALATFDRDDAATNAAKALSAQGYAVHLDDGWVSAAQSTATNVKLIASLT